MFPIGKNFSIQPYYCRTHTHTHTHTRIHTDIATMLKQLGLEHYQERFEEEELDFDTFLTMTESDLKEIGVNTLGARRKIQIAISGINVYSKYTYMYNDIISPNRQEQKKTCGLSVKITIKFVTLHRVEKSS